MTQYTRNWPFYCQVRHLSTKADSTSFLISQQRIGYKNNENLKYSGLKRSQRRKRNQEDHDWSNQCMTWDFERNSLGCSVVTVNWSKSQFINRHFLTRYMQSTVVNAPIIGLETEELLSLDLTYVDVIAWHNSWRT